jgi:hypothetical protein
MSDQFSVKEKLARPEIISDVVDIANQVSGSTNWAPLYEMEKNYLGVDEQTVRDVGLAHLQAKCMGLIKKHSGDQNGEA